MKTLDKLIEERGFQKGEVVKLGYNDIVNFANQRVIEELHNLYNEEEEHNDCISKELLYQRIKELKQQVCYKSNKPCEHNCGGLCKDSY